VLSLSEIGASFLVVPPGRTTLSIRFFTLIHYGVYPDAAGICLILLLMVGAAGAGIAAIVWPAVRRRLT
jgi:iron(III) transport system permease protein